MAKETLQDIINDFSPEKFIHFFRLKNRSFKPYTEPTPEYNDDQFTDALFLGEIPSNETDKLVIYSFRVNKDLTERSGKKAQYEKGKKILKDSLADAGIFIFYDENGNFRFSLITVNYTGTKRQFSHFKRYTYYVSPAETNKTFLNQIGRADFSSIDSIKEAFSVEKVTKEFYQEIANWYFWALKHAKFPPQAEAEPNGRNIAVIRLITRIIFIWFMKQKGIVPDYLFDREKALPEILKDLSDDKSTYYKAILQNLFFATLNTKKDERRFREEKRYSKGYNPDFGNQYVYRYHSLFKSPEKMEEYFNKIPFLNGGLFECLDDGKKNIYIDGFTERSRKYQPVVPNFLFFSGERTEDLSKDYGEAKYKKAKVRGLINILKSYNFTIDENTPVDEEVALDPELLGKVFENLLASYNPETATTARKATGSYYTPREVVDYMVEESLKEYFVTTIPDIDRENLDILFSYESDKNPFKDNESEKLISAINRLKVIDPAVGSGAFPMGILHKLVYILHKLDPHNRKWKEEQIKAVEHNVKDPALRQELIKKIEENFTLNELDYGRKLYLIQNCIYGVDIQPIAIQIAKLRFFISLLVDVKVDKTKDNYGIEPLPNLETKFVAANTLINLNNMTSMLPQKLERINQLRESLFNLRQEYFSTWDNEKKKEIKEQDKKLREAMQKIIKDYIEKINRKITPLKEELEAVPKEKEIVTRKEKALFETITVRVDLNELKRQEIQNKIDKIKAEISSYERLLESFQKIIDWDPYDTEHYANWFDPEWMFGVKDGFDIVIGNPPHGADLSEYLDDILPYYDFYDSRKNSASFFMYLTTKLTKNNGVTAYIIPKSLTFVEGWRKPREFIVNKNKLLVALDISKSFENVLLEQVVVIYRSNISNNNYKISIGSGWNKSINLSGIINRSLIYGLDIIPCNLDVRKLSILKKIQTDSVLLSEISRTFRGLPWQKR